MDDEGKDAEGKADPATDDQEVGGPVVAVVAEDVPNSNHDQSDELQDHYLEQTKQTERGFALGHSWLF